MVDLAPPPEAVLPELAALLRGRVLVAHNAAFDARVLRQAFARAALDWPNPPVLCTVALARRFAPLQRRRGLASLADALGIEVAAVHRALPDAETCARVLCALLPRLVAVASTVGDALARAAGPSAAPGRGGRAPGAKRPRDQRPDLSKLPKDPGVYIFRDADGHPLYVGKSVCLRTRARAHFTTPVAWTGQAEHVDYQPTESELGALVLENRLIKRLRPPGNVNLKKSADGYVYLRCRLDIPYPILEVAREPAAGHAVCVGPVRGRAAAAELVEQLNSLFGLRHCGRGHAAAPVAVRLRADGPLPVALPRRPRSEPLPRAAGRRRCGCSSGATAAAALLAHVDGQIRARVAGEQAYERAAWLQRRRKRLDSLLGRLGGALRAAHAGRPARARAASERRRRARTRSGSSAGASSTGARRPPTPTSSSARTRVALRSAPRPGLGGWLPAEELDEARIVGAVAGEPRRGARWWSCVRRVITGLDHVQVAAPPGCEEAARAFYGELLGLPEVAKPESLRAAGGAWFQRRRAAAARRRRRAVRARAQGPPRPGGRGPGRRSPTASPRRARRSRWDDRLPGVRALLHRRPVGQPARATCRAAPAEDGERPER